MRGMAARALSCTLLATMVAVGTAGASPAPPRPEARQVTELPEQLDDGVVLVLPEGDRYKVWHSSDDSKVWGQRYDAATSTWQAPAVLLQERNLACGRVDARSSNGAVAVLAWCDKPGYSDDQAPPHSRALYSADTVTWSTDDFDLGVEVYHDPAISPDGRSAVWPHDDGYLTWTPAEGFRERPLDVAVTSLTATITDDGTVSYLHSVRDDDGTPCRVDVLTRLGDGPLGQQSVQLADDVCAGLGHLTNVDALTVRFGPEDTRPYRSVLGRPDQSSAWAVTSLAPAYARGLLHHRSIVRTTFFSSPGLPLVALGSPDRRVFQAQTYDEATRTWGAVRTVARLDAACRWDPQATSAGSGFPVTEHHAVMVAELRCDGRLFSLISADGHTWSAAPVRRPLGFAADGRWVSTSNRRSTAVFSQEAGRVRLPVGAPRRCDAVIPASPTSALRLTTSRASGWPTALHVSTPSGWRRTDTAMPAVPERLDTCRRVRSFDYDGVGQPVYMFIGRGGETFRLAVVAHEGGWRVRRLRP